MKLKERKPKVLTVSYTTFVTQSIKAKHQKLSFRVLTLKPRLRSPQLRFRLPALGPSPLSVPSQSDAFPGNRSAPGRRPRRQRPRSLRLPVTLEIRKFKIRADQRTTLHFIFDHHVSNICTKKVTFESSAQRIRCRLKDVL